MFKAIVAIVDVVVAIVVVKDLRGRIIANSSDFMMWQSGSRVPLGWPTSFYLDCCPVIMRYVFFTCA